MALLIIAVFLGFVAIAVPVAIALGISGTLGIYLSPGGQDALAVLPEQMFVSLNSFTLLTIPLFVFAGTIMAQGGVAARLMDFASRTVGRRQGGLGAAIVVAALFFHGISGSSTADTAAVGRVTLPTLTRQGYPLAFSTALLATAGATALLIPPTVDLIIVGIVANISIAGLFAGAIIPACVNAAGMIAYVIYHARKHGYGVDPVPAERGPRAVGLSFVRTIPAFIMVVIILGGILGGVFTPTEASTVAVVYGLFVAVLVYRDLKVRAIPAVLRATIELTGMVMLLLAMSSILSYAFTVDQVPDQLAQGIKSIASNKFVFLLLVQIVFFVIGMFMDGVPAELILMPILTPIAVSYGIQPIHFGILVVANVGLGLAHPPVGLCLNTACAIAGIPVERAIRPLLPFIAISWITLLIITYDEGLTMFVPNLLGLAK